MNKFIFFSIILSLIYTAPPPNLFRTLSTPTIPRQKLSEKLDQFLDLNIIVLRIAANDKILTWDGKIENTEYNPGIGTNIVDFWIENSEVQNIAVYQQAKSSRRSQRFVGNIGNEHYLWYFVPQYHHDQEVVSGYILNIDFIYLNLLSTERKFEDAQMMQSALTSHQTRYQCYNIIMRLQSIQETIPILKKTHIKDILCNDGKVLKHDELCDELFQDANKAERFTAILLKRQQQCEDIIACQQQTLKLVYKSFDVVNLIKTMWKDSYIEANRKKVIVSLEIDPLCDSRLPVIEQDEFRFRQICQTVIDNAIANTPEGGKVDIYVGIDLHQIVIQVTDSGVGIKQETLQSFGDKMQSGKLSFSQPRPEAGLGLSLAIAQHIIHLMNGELKIMTCHEDELGDAECADDTGSKISLVIPCKHKSVEAFRSSNPDQIDIMKRKYDDRQTNNRFTIDQRNIILVVDDDDIILTFWKKVLQVLGYEYHLCSDGSEAISYYEASHTRIALIFMDIQMPMDGITTSRAIRRFEDRMNLPTRLNIIANTASGATDAFRDECINAGLNLFIQKPNSKKDIKRLIETYATFV